MRNQIYNGGLEAGLLRLAKEEGATLTPDQEARLALLDSLPRNQWIDLDRDGNPITSEEADRREAEFLSTLKITKQ